MVLFAHESFTGFFWSNYIQSIKTVVLQRLTQASISICKGIINEGCNNIKYIT